MKTFSLLLLLLLVSANAWSSGRTSDITGNDGRLAHRTDSSIYCERTAHSIDSTLYCGRPAQYRQWKSNALMIGVGHANILDTYLSPEKYRGTTLRFLSHTRRGKPSTSLVRQLTHEGELAFADNRSGNGGEIALGYTFRYALLKQWRLTIGQRPVNILAGGTAALNIGMLYNTRNGNNPANARLSLHIEPTVAADVPIGTARHTRGVRFSPSACAAYPVVVHYEASIPLIGLMFSPNYGQSYYEIFSRGNYDHNCVPTTIAATPSFRQMLTLDFRALRTTWRIGYLGEWRQASVNNLKQHLFAHSVVVGVVRSF